MLPILETENYARQCVFESITTSQVAVTMLVIHIGYFTNLSCNSKSSSFH